MTKFSDYIIYIDESGDHGLTSIDPGYPIFVLAFCIFHKQDYANHVVPALQLFKFKHFGHDMVVLHEREIRKDKGMFRFLNTKEKKQAFLSDLTVIVEEAPFTLIASVIKKDALNQQYVQPDNPYHLAMTFGLERATAFIQSKGQGDKITNWSWNSDVSAMEQTG